MKSEYAARYGFKIVSSLLEHENPYYAVYKHEVRYPDGSIESYWVQEKNDFSVIIPLFPDKTTLLVGQYRIPADLYTWEFPAGSVKNKEPLSNAKEELQEETGYSAEKWTQLGQYFLGPEMTDGKINVFIAENLTPGEPKPEKKEILEVKHVLIDSIGKMITAGEILDGPTIVAYHYLEEYLKSR